MSSLTITRITHACALLDFGGVTILTDPWFSEKPTSPRAYQDAASDLAPDTAVHVLPPGTPLTI